MRVEAEAEQAQEVLFQRSPTFVALTGKVSKRVREMANLLGLSTQIQIRGSKLTVQELEQIVQTMRSNISLTDKKQENI